MTEAHAAREAMVRDQIAARGVSDPRVLAAMATIPREAFVPDHLRGHAYDDRALPIEAGQTISQPYIVALMAEAAAIGPGDRVLEVGAGSGYAASVLGQLARLVIGIERHAELAELAAERVVKLSYDNVRVILGDGTNGCPNEAPFDAILIPAAGPEPPRTLIDQLVPSGRLIMPVGGTHYQQLIRFTRTPEGELRRDDLGPVAFVPLVSG